ncbi:MAG: hypothetical protein PHN31_04635 [Candidatus Gracilibacteria bacterium]|nr:hypothetical protein [Candidatus Gracilibacteria bacterium]
MDDFVSNEGIGGLNDNPQGITRADILNLTDEQVLAKIDEILLKGTNERLQIFTQLYNGDYNLGTEHNL